MKIGIITHALHKKSKDYFFAYEPYVREMNLWIKTVDEVVILSPLSLNEEVTNIETPYRHTNIEVVKIPSFDITSFKNFIKAFFVVPLVCLRILKVMKHVDHIHLRCPGNIGLLGSIIQIFFPSKPKTVKYAGNWDPKSQQPLTYRLQKWILSNTFLTRNTKVLVYGQWENQSKNIVPFFTVSYSKNDIEDVEPKPLKNKIKLLFVGGFTKGKQPLLSVKVAHELLLKGFDVQLDMFGDGEEFKVVEEYIAKNKLTQSIFLHGNQSKEIVKKAYQKSHFLVFLSKSEGWPKVVAEAMFWSCLPISTAISCVPFMLGNGERGSLVGSNIDEIAMIIEDYLNNEKLYLEKVIKAREWSQQFTLELFESEIQKFL